MKTKLMIDDGLIQEAMKLSRYQTKEAVVTEALQEYIQRRNQTRIIELFGKIDFEKKYDYKKARRRS